MKTIEFNIGEENKPVYEDLTKLDVWESSYFSNQYEKGLKLIDFYLQGIQNDISCVEKKRDMSFKEYDNNIFAFVGDRGSGKTSCMMSLTDYLCKERSRIEDQKLTNYPNIKGKCFKRLNLIDPSYFETDKESILGHVIAQLLNMYKNLVLDDATHKWSEKEEKLLYKFSEVNKNIKYLEQASRDTDDFLEELNSLSAAVNLKSSIEELFEQFLNYAHWENTILIIPIDDIDLNRTGVTNMIEQIRKYLINPNLLILMAFNTKQMYMIETQEFAKTYKTMIDGKQIDFNDVNDMAEKYLEKFIPQGRRIALPDVSILFKSPLKINSSKKEPYKFATIRQAVTELIYRKTHYLFYNAKDTTSLIVPPNLRELRHLVRMLYNMEDYNATVNDKVAHNSYNKELFKKYLFDTWTVNNLDIDDQKYIDEILNVRDIIQFNSTVLDVLKRKFSKTDSDESDKLGDVYISNESHEIASILASKNEVFNISIGDVLSFVNELSIQYKGAKTRKFLFLIKAIYTIKLGESYEFSIDNNGRKGDNDEIRLDGVHEYSIDEIVEEDKTNTPRILGYTKKNKYDLSDLQILIAGNYFNSKIDNFLPKDNITNEQRSYRKINLKALNDLVSKCADEWDKIEPVKVQIVEFFMLCTSRALPSHSFDDRLYDFKYRQKKYPYYAKSLENNRGNAFFDINALFYNLLNIEQCYNRFKNGDMLYELADKEPLTDNPKSLLARFKDEMRKKQQRYDHLTNNKDWLHWVTLRNIEVLEYIKEFMNSQTYLYSKEKILSEYFDRLAKIKIPTYSDDGEERVKYIDFTYLDIISKTVGEICKSSIFVDIFNHPIEYTPTIDTNKIVRKRQKTYTTKNILKRLHEAFPLYATDRFKNLFNECFVDRFKEKYILTKDITKAIEEFNKRV